jgi:hypothetical protein
MTPKGKKRLWKVPADPEEVRMELSQLRFGKVGKVWG